MPLSVAPIPYQGNLSVSPIPQPAPLSVAAPIPTQPLQVTQQPQGHISLDPMAQALQDYNKVNYFLSDGSQLDSNGKPYDPGKIVFEAPDYFVNSDFFKQNIQPIVEQEVTYDADGTPHHPLLTKEVEDGVNQAFDAQKQYEDTVQSVTQNMGLDRKGATAFLDTLSDAQNSNKITLPNGSEMKVDDLKKEFDGYGDVQKASILQRYNNLAKDTSASPESRGRAAALLSIADENGYNKSGGFWGKLGYANALAGTEILKSGYGLADLVIPDSLAKVSKYDDSSLADQVKLQNEILTNNLKGYSGYMKAGTLYGVGLNIALSTLAGNYAAAGAKALSAKTLFSIGNSLQDLGMSYAAAGTIAGDADVFIQGGRGMAALGEGLSTLGQFIPKSKLAGIALEAPAQALAFTALDPSTHEDFGKSFLKNAAIFAGADLLNLGLMKGIGYLKEASKAVTVAGLGAEQAGSITKAVTSDIEDIGKMVSTEGSGARVAFHAPEASIGQTGSRGTEAILDSAEAGKSLSNTVQNGFIERLEGVTPEQSAELFVNGDKAGVIEKVLGKELGGEVRTFLDSIKDSANSLGLRIETRENFLPRTGAIERDTTAAAGSPRFKVRSLSENERTYQSGGELLKAAGKVDNVTLPDLLRNYVREVSDAALNRAATLKMIQSGQIVRVAREVAGEASPTLRAAYENGGLVKLTKTIEGSEITVGYAATPEWLAQHGFREISNPVVDGAFTQLKGLSKDYASGFYASDETVRLLDNYVSRPTASIGTSTIAKTAALSTKVQDLILSGGIPFTPANSFAITQTLSAMMADPLHFAKYVGDFGKAFSESTARKFFLDSLESTAGKANLTDFAKYGGVNLIPTGLFKGAETEATGLNLSESSVKALDEVGALKAGASTDLSAAQTARNEANRAQTASERATEKLAAAETATRQSAASASSLPGLQKKADAAAAKAKELEAAATKLEGISTKSKSTFEAASAAEQQSGAAYDILQATDNRNFAKKGIDGAKEIPELWDKAVGGATFDRLMPMLQWDTTRGIIQKGLDSGLSEAEAYQKGAEALKNFWNVGPKNGLGVWGGKQTQKVIEDIKTTFIGAPKYRAGMINRWWNTLKLLDPRKLTDLSYRLNARWALTGLSLFIGFNVANKAANGHYTWQNPTGSIDELQIPYGDGQILRFSVWGSQGSIVRQIARGTKDAVTGDGKGALNEAVGASSLLTQPLLRTALNLDYTGAPLYGDGGSQGKETPLNVANYLLGRYTAHPFVQAAQNVEKDNVLGAVLGALELPVKTTNLKTAARGDFYYNVIPDVQSIVDDYSGQMNRTFDNNEKEDLFKKMIDKITQRTKTYGNKWNFDIGDMDTDMAHKLLTTIQGKESVPLTDSGVLDNSQQQDVASNQRAKIRSTAQAAGLDLYRKPGITTDGNGNLQIQTANDALTDAKNKIYGAPKRVAAEFAQAIKEDKTNGIPSLYTVKQSYDKQISVLYDQAKGLKGDAATAIYDKISQIQEAYMAKFDERLQPLIAKYGTGVLANNSDVFKALQSYIEVPNDLTPFASSRKQPYLTADVKQYLKDRYGVGPLSQGNIATDPEVLAAIKKANSQVAAGKAASASYTLTQAQQKVNKGKLFADQDTMDVIAKQIQAINKRK